MSKQETGEVTAFDAMTGVASVLLPSGQATIPAGAFYSGRPACLPVVGDRVRATFRQNGDDLLVLVARLIR